MELYALHQPPETQPSQEVTIKGKTAVETVTDYIKSLIERRELRIGDKVPTETELCKKLNVGRGSVREAEKRLEAIRVLEIRRGDGTYIANVKGAGALDALYYKIILEDISIQELVDYRIQIETNIINLAIAHATLEEIQMLEQNYLAFKHCIQDDQIKDAETLNHMDVEFHELLAKCANNRLMEDIYLFSLKIFAPMMLKNYKSGKVEHDGATILDNHRDILEAIRNRDVYGGIYAVKAANALWKKWIRVWSANGKTPLFNDNLFD